MFKMLYEKFVSDNFNKSEKYSLFSKKYFKLADSANIFMISNLNFSNKTLPFSEKFYIGGTESVPGYHRNEFHVSNSYYMNFGIDIKLREIISLINRKLYLSLMAGAGETSEDKKFNFKNKDLLYGFGTSLGLITGLGKLEMSYAVNRDSEKNFYFKFGYGL
jgi:outer membrane translocation and assembly module TamA